MSTYDLIKLAIDILIVPMFGMIWGVQGRISKMEGELKALYSIVEMIVKRKED